MFIEGLKYPFGKDNLMKILGYGTLLILCSFLILPIFIIVGYMARVIESNPSPGDTKLPPIDDFGGLLVDGVKLTGVNIAYMVLGLCVLGTTFWLSMTFDSLFILGLVGVVTIPAIIIVTMIQAGAMVNFAKNGCKFGKGFAMGEILQFTFKLKYIIAVTISMFVYPLIEAVISTGLTMTGIGMILYPTLIFMFIISRSYVLSNGYDEVMK